MACRAAGFISDALTPGPRGGSFPPLDLDGGVCARRLAEIRILIQIVFIKLDYTETPPGSSSSILTGPKRNSVVIMNSHWSGGIGMKHKYGGLFFHAGRSFHSVRPETARPDRRRAGTATGS